MLKTVRTNFDRRELRRDRRYALPRMTVTINGADYVTGDWSLGGFHIVDGPSLAIGEQVAGAIQIEGRDGRYDFTAEVVRNNGAGHDVGFHFVELSSELVTVLDRAAFRRFAGRR
jgi:hypothetical protein